MYSYQLFDEIIALIKERYISKDSFSFFFPLLEVINIILVVNQLASN